MIAWLWKLIVGDFYKCRHKWSTEQTVEVWARPEDDHKHPVAFDKHLRCEKCGEWEKRRL